MSFLNKIKLTNSCINKFKLKNIESFYFTNIHEGTNKEYDVIIIGGGMIGLTLGCSLGQNSWFADKKILLLELGPKLKFNLKPTYSNRVISINHKTRSLLETLGAWKFIENARFKKVKKMQVWESCSDALLTFNYEGLSQDVSYIVENNLLLAAVNEQIQKLKNVDIEYNSNIKDFKLPLDPVKDKPMIVKEDGSKYTCKLLIGADGFNSKVRQAMGIKYFSWLYNQRGIVATLQLSEPTDNNVAWQRFLPTGPIALLPLNDEYSSLVWTVNEKEANKLLVLPDEQFVDAVNDAFWRESEKPRGVDELSKRFLQILGGAASGAVRQLPPSIKNIEPGSRAAFPLGLGHATRYIQPGTALVGDAAHRIHPLAGQGVNLGFGDIESLTRHLAETASIGEQIGGDMYTLAKYETERQRHNIGFLAATHGLQLLYSTSWAPIVLARSLGVHLTNSMPPLKRAIMDHASN